MKREPTAKEYDAIARAMEAGDRIQAISQYMAITECGLTEAQNFVHGLAADTRVKEPGEMREHSRGKPGKKWWRMLGFR